jgi:hypothetical protein
VRGAPPERRPAPEHEYVGEVDLVDPVVVRAGGADSAATGSGNADPQQRVAFGQRPDGERGFGLAAADVEDTDHVGLIAPTLIAPLVRRRGQSARAAAHEPGGNQQAVEPRQPVVVDRPVQGSDNILR